MTYGLDHNASCIRASFIRHSSGKGALKTMIRWIYGPPCSGKTTLLASASGIKLDSHTLRELSGDWDISPIGRERNLRKIIAVALELERQGLDVAVAAVTPKVEQRELIKSKAEYVEFILADYDRDNLKSRQWSRFGETYIDEGFEYDE